MDYSSNNLMTKFIYVGAIYALIKSNSFVRDFVGGVSTTFTQNVDAFRVTDKSVALDVVVTNTGDVSGKEVVQVYYAPAQGALSKPVRNLIRFEKTKELAEKQAQL